MTTYTNNFEYFIYACILLAIGITLFRFCFVKIKELMAIGFYAHNAKSNRARSIDQRKVIMFIRFYYLGVLLAFGCFGISIYLIKILISYE